MFDKLIESNMAAADFKPRRKFFMVSSVVVGILFLSAVVFSLYAQDIDLGTDNFEIAELIAPIVADAPEPPKPKQQQPQQQKNDQQKSELPSRPILVDRIDRSTQVPMAISITRNPIPEIPDGAFELDPSRPSSDGSGPARSTDGPGSSSAVSAVSDVAEVVKTEAPPPIPKVEPKKPTTISKGVINGEAISLPKPPYPPHAIAVGAHGEVSVQILINEQGSVVSAKAISGHGLLKAEAERAAWKARFKPTYLSEVPVKVTGVIVYRFTKR